MPASPLILFVFQEFAFQNHIGGGACLARPAARRSLPPSDLRVRVDVRHIRQVRRDPAD
jgi:hypothetical protein